MNLIKIETYDWQRLVADTYVFAKRQMEQEEKNNERNAVKENCQAERMARKRVSV